MRITVTHRLLLWCTALALSGCDCQSDGPSHSRVRIADKPGDEFPLHDGEQFDPDQRAVADELIALVKQYYPVWHHECETVDDYYARYAHSPEIQRFRALIEEREQTDHTWRACLSEIQTAMRGKLFVRDGSPPSFGVPSFQVVLGGWNRDVHTYMVFRLSMLAPFYDYYETISERARHNWQRRLTPTRDTASIARLVRGIIAKHFPGYRELPPEIGAIRLSDMSTPNRLINDDVNLADALFEDSRSW